MSYRKKFFNGIILLLIVIFCSYIWNYIKIPFNSDKEAIGALSKLKLNNFNDTLRYLIFMGLPFIFYFFLILKNYKNDFVKTLYDLITPNCKWDNDKYNDVIEKLKDMKVKVKGLKPLKGLFPDMYKKNKKTNYLS